MREKLKEIKIQLENDLKSFKPTGKHKQLLGDLLEATEFASDKMKEIMNKIDMLGIKNDEEFKEIGEMQELVSNFVLGKNL